MNSFLIIAGIITYSTLLLALGVVFTGIIRKREDFRRGQLLLAVTILFGVISVEQIPPALSLIPPAFIQWCMIPATLFLSHSLFCLVHMEVSEEMVRRERISSMIHALPILLSVIDTRTQSFLLQVISPLLFLSIALYFIFKNNRICFSSGVSTLLISICAFLVIPIVLLLTIYLPEGITQYSLVGAVSFAAANALSGLVVYRSLKSDDTQRRDMSQQLSELGGSLTCREREILQTMVKGLSNREIAEEKSISLFTVKTHVSNIYRKLDVSGRYELLAKFSPLSFA